MKPSSRTCWGWTDEIDGKQQNQAPIDEVEIEEDDGIEETNGNGFSSQKQIPKQGVGSKKLNKKRSRSNDGLAETLMETMINFGKKYKETNGHVATIASCFKIEAWGAERRMKIRNELVRTDAQIQI